MAPDGTECTQFHGLRVGEWDAGRVVLSETQYRPGQRAVRHAHRAATLAFVLGGGFTESQGARTLQCPPGAVLLRPAWLEHDDRFSEDGGHCFNIELPTELVPSTAAGAMDCRAGEPAWTAHRLLSSLRSGTLDTLALESLIARLIEALCPAPTPKMSARMARVARELRERFAQPWSLRELAREAQVHPVHFARAFRRAYGESVGEYVHRLRVEHAARELARTPAPLAEIAHDAGFADQAHLTRVFRRRTGATPARFRRTFQQRKTFQSFNTA